MTFRFERGTKVRWTDTLGRQYYGEVTIVTADSCKVMFSNTSSNCEAWFPEYDYYPEGELTIVDEVDFQKAVVKCQEQV